MGKAYSENKKKYIIEYSKKTYKRIPLDVRRDYYEEVLSKIPERMGMPINAFIKEAIREKIERVGLDLSDTRL